jgi:hypothetical protein
MLNITPAKNFNNWKAKPARPDQFKSFINLFAIITIFLFINAFLVTSFMTLPKKLYKMSTESLGKNRTWYDFNNLLISIILHGKNEEDEQKQEGGQDEQQNNYDWMTGLTGLFFMKKWYSTLISSWNKEDIPNDFIVPSLIYYVLPLPFIIGIFYYIASVILSAVGPIGFKDKFLEKIEDDDTKNAINSNLTVIGAIVALLVIGGSTLFGTGLGMNNSLLTNFGVILLLLGVSYPTITGLRYIFGNNSQWKLQKELLYKCSQQFIMIYMSVLTILLWGYIGPYAALGAFSCIIAWVIGYVLISSKK